MTGNYIIRGDIGIYKANKKKTGAVAQFKLANDGKCMFLEMAKQIREPDDPAPYDWKDTKVVVKLGIVDITKFLAYFDPQIMYYRNAPAPLELYHQTPTGSKTISIKWQEMEWKGKVTHSYYLSVSAKQGSQAPIRIGCPISLDEVELLKVGFKRALEIILAW